MGFEQLRVVQAELYKHRRWLEAGNFGFVKLKNCTTRIPVAKTKAPNRFLSASHYSLFSHMQIVGFLMMRSTFERLRRYIVSIGRKQAIESLILISLLDHDI